MFIYRGKEYERLTDFSTRMMNHLPNAELMNKLEPPGPEIQESSAQCILFIHHNFFFFMEEKRGVSMFLLFSFHSK